MPQLFLFYFLFSSSRAAWRLLFHLLWRSQTNAIHAIEVTFDTIWEFLGTILIPNVQVSTCIRLYSKKKDTESLRKSFSHPSFAKMELF